MIYGFFKYLVIIALRIFYKKFSVNKPFELPSSGPFLIVGNHPNTFMDPMIIGTLFKQQIGFLANASIFVNSYVNRFFALFNVIPVYRQQDVAEGVKPDNRQTFSACYAFLEKGKPIMLFPEGTSFHELKLRKIKTGAARIAFGVEEQNNFSLGIKILPVGLYYNNPAKFNSKVYINVGTFIDVKKYEGLYLENEGDAVRQLTDEIKSALENLTISTSDEEQEEVFVMVKRIYKSHLFKKHPQIDTSNEFVLTKEIANAIQYFRITFPDRYEFLKEKIIHCNALLNTQKSDRRYRLPVILQLPLRLLYAMLGIPFFLFGLIQNYIPFQLPNWIAKKITSEVEYHAPVMMSIGIFLFPLWYGLSTFCFAIIFDLGWPINTVYFLGLILSGYYSLHYFYFLKESLVFYNTHVTLKSKENQLHEVNELKEDIIRELDDARQAYLNRL